MKSKSVVFALLLVPMIGIGQELLPSVSPAQAIPSVSTSVHAPNGFDSANGEIETDPLANAWGLDILISNDGFGLGTFYRREFSPDLFGFVSFSISESKDEREVDRIDFTGQTYTPGKISRFFVLPLMFGLQRRLFREDIVDNFRPYVNAGVGPAMIYSSPFTEVTPLTGGGYAFRQIEFFESLGKGQPHYTLGGYIGFGANFGSEKTNLFGVNFRYYFTYLFSDGLPSLFSPLDPTFATSKKKSFGGFFITLNVGRIY